MSSPARKEPRRPSGFLSRLVRNADGIAITEFGFVAPIFLLLLMGIFDMGYAVYINTVLQGAVQEGARKASLENTVWSDIERKVNSQIRNVVPSGDPDTDITFDLDSSVYQSYNEIVMGEHFVDKERAPFQKNNTYDGDEAFTDSNSNDIWDPGEPFTDRSRGVKNGIRDSDECFIDRDGDRFWDDDVGDASTRGSGQDVVAITATLHYKRVFPFWRMIGQPQTQVLSATTFLRNQPFSAQSTRTGVEVCT